MKVLQINVVARSGSTGKIMADIDKQLRVGGHESVICYGRLSGSSMFMTGVDSNGDFKFCSEAEAALQKILNKLGGLQYGGNTLPTRRLIKQIKQQRPDIVHLHCINGYCVNIYRLLDYLAKSEIPTVVTHHAEFFYTGNCGHALECMRFADDECHKCPHKTAATGSLTFDRAHTAWRKMKDAFAKFNKDKLIFTTVSPWVASRAALSPITRDVKTEVLLNGLNTDIFKLSEGENDILSRIPGRKAKVALHVTASFSDDAASFKGGHYIVELAKAMPDVTFVVASIYADVTSDLPENLFLWGRTKNQTELAELYNAADCTVISSKRETFSMVVAESLCCGTPVVGFKAGGPESIALSEFSKFVDYGDAEALKSVLEAKLNTPGDSEHISAIARSKYSQQRMASEFIDIYKSLIHRR